MHPRANMAQGRGNAMVFTLAVFALLQVAAAKTSTVGGSTGWTFPAPSDPNFYTEWASGQNFVAGDELRMILPSILYDFSALTH